jgi:hypothetical protein
MAHVGNGDTIKKTFSRPMQFFLAPNGDRMEAGVEETEENNAFSADVFLFAFGIIILLCSLFPLQLNVNSFSFRFH